nr:hypothetical protein [Tanacetum cinerariifolium]
ETAQEIWLRVQQMMKGSNIRIQEKKAKLFNEWERLKKDQEKDKIGSKPDKNGKRGEAGKCQK